MRASLARFSGVLVQCGVNKRTIQCDLNDLDVAGVPVWDDEQGRHGIASGYYVPPVHFDLDEAASLYLAARLLARYSDEHSPPIVTALAKLAGVLPEEMAGHIHRTVRSLTYRPEILAFSRVMEVIVLGWATGRKVRIWHRPGQGQRVREYVEEQLIVTRGPSIAVGVLDYLERP